MSILFSPIFSKNNEIRPQEANFTEVLSSIALVPKMLYFYGKLPEKRDFRGGEGAGNGADLGGENELNGQVFGGDGWPKYGLGSGARPPVVAIVGTRRPTKYGEMVAHELAYEVAKRGGVVVSGLAFGIDATAHRGALEAGGVTVAVLGTPIDQIYPRAHYGLAEKIVATGGCVMSELPPGAVSGRDFHPKTCFLRRNRLIAGLADVVVIPEAAERSGSLNTAAHALEQGREVFAVPGDIMRPMSKGCNRLICQGATPYLGVEDVLRILFPEQARKVRKAEANSLLGDTEEETAILRALAEGLREGEEIIQRTALAVPSFNQAVTMLELKGRVRALGANRWALC